MLFGCNFSKTLMELLHKDDSLCDYIKIGAFGKTEAFLDEAYALKPLLLHGFGWFERGGMKDMSVMDYEHMNAYLTKYQTPYLGMHALAYPDDASQVSDMLAHMAGVFTEISERLECELIIENMDHSLHYDYETSVIETVTPEFYTELLERTGLNMLFDLSHALVSAYQLGIGIYDYLEGLPLEKIREIHISGSFYSNEIGYKDIHGIMNEDDYRIAEFLSNHPRVKQSGCLKMVTLEYGTVDVADPEAIVTQMNRLKKIFSNECHGNGLE